MATQRTTLHHEPTAQVELKPTNPVYENRMYISGFLGFISTSYKKELISYDGVEEIWTCKKCGLPLDDAIHQPEIIKANTI